MRSDDTGGNPVPKKYFGFASSPLWPGVLLFLFVFLAYFPALHGGFVWDDDSHISANPTLRSLKGLWQIWFEPGATCQYYPLSFTVFWAGYQLWGLNTFGYHVLNVAMHGLVSVLLWQVLARLKVRGAWFAGAIFALHPVCVMSVAWMTELKNTLSAALALGAAWAYVRFARLGIYNVPASGNDSLKADGFGVDWRYGVLAVALFLLAMFAKTAVSFLPVTLLLVAWWQQKRPGWREMMPLFLMLVMIVVMGEATFYIERIHGAAGSGFHLSLLERMLVSGRAFWFYLGKLFFPYPLSFIYERWDVNTAAGWQYLYPAAMAGLFAILWWMRKVIGRGPFAALLHFYISTSLLILMVVLFMTRYTFVSDHWEYFGCMSVFALIAAGITLMLDRLGNRILKPVLCGILLLVLGGLTWRQAGVYRNSETLWRDTLAKNPGSWMAHDNLGAEMLAAGRLKEAMDHFRRSIQINPDGYAAHNDYGAALRQSGRLDEAETEIRRALELAPNLVEIHINQVELLEKKGRLNEAVQEYKVILQLVPASEPGRIGLANALCLLGRADEAVPYYRDVLQSDPNNTDVHIRLGLALIETGDFGAVETEFTSVLQTDPRNARAIDGLGYALAMQGRLDEARARFLESLQLDPKYAYTHLHYAMCLSAQRQSREAIGEYRKALELNDQLPTACNNLAWMLASNPDPQIRDGREAVKLAERACRLTGNEIPFYLGTLAAAYAEAGRFNDAIATAEKARDLARKAGLEDVVKRNEQLLELYRSGRPYHEPANAG